MTSTEDTQCEVPGCTFEREFIAPGNWCKNHWNMWMNWPEDKPEPKWMPKKDD